MAAPRLEADEIAAATAVLASGSLRQGSVTAEFESAVASFVSSKHAFACSSGTAALHLAYLTAIEPGDEVLVPAFTFFATASAVSLAGGTPIFCDVDPQTYLLDLDDAASKITDNTRAIAPVYLFGNPFDEEAMKAFGAKHDLVVGDAAQALGSRRYGRHVGTTAHITTHSFYPTKYLFVGEGGMVTTNDDGFDDMGRLLRSHGQRPKYHHNVLGLNYRLTDVEAAIGLAQLPKVELRNERSRALASVYNEALGGLDAIRTPIEPPQAHHTYHQYTITVLPDSPIDRDQLQAALARVGIQSQINYPVPRPSPAGFCALVRLRCCDSANRRRSGDPSTFDPGAPRPQRHRGRAGGRSHRSCVRRSGSKRPHVTCIRQ